jgi:hypothetical protein
VSGAQILQFPPRARFARGEPSVPVIFAAGLSIFALLGLAFGLLIGAFLSFIH